MTLYFLTTKTTDITMESNSLTKIMKKTVSKYDNFEEYAKSVKEYTDEQFGDDLHKWFVESGVETEAKHATTSQLLASLLEIRTQKQKLNIISAVKFEINDKLKYKYIDINI